MIEKRFKERNGRPWGEMSMNGSEQAGEGVGLLIRKRVSITQTAPGDEGQILVSLDGALLLCAGARD